MNVFLGMSGGVDSSLSASILKEAGHHVTGVSLVLFESSGTPSPTSCCSLNAVKEAARTAAISGVEHRIIDARDLFIEKVITPFAESYSKGQTPNPCVLCNRHVKFPILLDEAKKTEGGLISTGHYARVEQLEGEAVLKTGTDPKKDQSYFLYALTREELDALILPLGAWRKDEVREKAREIGLPVFSKPESQEICFVDDQGYGNMVKAIEPEADKKGLILDINGKELGAHKGIIHYTIGQRRGLGLSNPEPSYVIKIDASSNNIVVGTRDEAHRDEIVVERINWLLKRTGKFSASVKVRSTARAIPASIIPEGTHARIIFKEPVFAPAPGQSAVFYDSDIVIGGGEIAQEEDKT
jgi:tRNA-specific 2-thiouridylase